MNVTLTPELEQYIADKVASGQYESKDDVIRQALWALDEKEEEAALRAGLKAAVQMALDQVARGEFSTKTATELLHEIRQRKAAEGAA